MLLTPFFILLGISAFLLILGYSGVVRGRTASLIGGYIVLMILGISILAGGIDYYNGETTVTEAAGVTSITEGTSTNTTINTSVGLTLLLISILGFFMGVQKAEEDSEVPY